MLKLGDKVRRLPFIHIDESGHRIVGTKEWGTVVYIHPAGRYHVVRFDYPGGSYRESYWGVEP